MNIFQSAKTLGEENEKILKTLDEVKEIVKEIENIKTRIDKVTNDIEKLQHIPKSIENDLNNVKKSTEKLIENNYNIVIEKWKIWSFFIPGIFFGIVFIIFFTLHLKMIVKIESRYDEKFGKFNDYIIKNYRLNYLDEKYWYDSKNQKLFLKEKNEIVKEIEKEKMELKKKAVKK